MNTNGSTPAGSVRSISTSPPASSVHSLDSSTAGAVVVVAVEEGAVVDEGSGTGTVVVVSTEEVGGGSGRGSLPVVAVEEGAVVEEGSGTGTVVVVTTEEVGAAGEGPSSAGVTPSSAAHPPATMAIANRTPSTGTHALVEYPTALTGRILSTVNGSRRRGIPIRPALPTRQVSMLRQRPTSLLVVRRIRAVSVLGRW